LYTAAVIEKENINKKIESAMFEQSNKIEEFINNGSNWVFFFKTAIAMDVEVGGVNPILEFLKLF
jgi:hypothetical protein